MATMVLLFTTFYGAASQTITFEPTLKYNAMQLCELAKPGVVEAFQTKDLAACVRLASAANEQARFRILR